jgi:hypothetical protein
LQSNIYDGWQKLRFTLLLASFNCRFLSRGHCSSYFFDKYAHGESKPENLKMEIKYRYCCAILMSFCGKFFSDLSAGYILIHFL